MVIGTRLDHEHGPAPKIAYTRKDIERFGVSTLGDLSRYFIQQPFSYGTGHLQSGAQSLQLRGLGVDTTLVLINGKRVSTSANSISQNTIDLNSFPVTAVERVEVMSDSASAIYGADAIGGVVNIILKRVVTQPEIQLHYGEADGGATQRRIAASFGASNDRLKSTLSLDFHETTSLMGQERDLTRNQDFRRFGGQDYRVSTTHAGNVYSLTGRPLPGLSSSRAAVPPGTAGIGLSPASFFATDGELNLGSSLSDWSIAPPWQRVSAYGSAEYLATETISLFGEFLVADAELTALRGPPSLTQQIVPASNPFNPFGEAVAVDYSFAGMGPISHVYETNLLRGVIGAQSRIGDWDLELTGLHHHENGSNTTRGGLDFERVSSAIQSTDPQSALNLFSDGPAGSTALLDSLIAPTQSLGFAFSSSQLSAIMRGPVLNLGGRSAELTVGGEWRLDAAGFFEAGKRIDVSRDVVSVFSEIKLPLFDKLSLKIALRADDYGDGGEQRLNPQYRALWQPLDEWTFRVAYGTSYRPPSLYELNMPVSRLTVPIADPLRGGELSNVGFIVGANRDLESVTAHSFTAGFSFQPSWISGLRLSGNYWRVQMENRIVLPIYSELLNPNGELTGRVVRDAPTAQDLLRGWAGPLRSIDLTRANFGELDTSGVDLEASFSVGSDFRGLQFKLSTTWVNDYSIRDMNQALPADRVGIANIQGTIPQWRVVGTMGGRLGAFGASTTATFTPSYQDADVWTGPLDRRIRSRVLVDLQAWMDLDILGTALLDDATVMLGARNVFDVAPEFANAGAAFGYDVSQNDLIGRFIYFRLSKRF
ncbi:MAG TPA: TonB-dependent receptor [Steroidobacter sp.]|uniref:TonB-dependent receptor plug domain-containing protein n=1 Tax=Steroidobacter sp. TaxID=1978227 RepID=UPI002ED8E3F3